MFQQVTAAPHRCKVLSMAYRTTLLVFLASLAGCRQPVNPSLSLSRQEGDTALAEMARRPVRQVRPLVILGGWRDILDIHSDLRKRLAPHFVDPQIIAIHFVDCGSFEVCRERLLTRLDAAMPSGDPDQTLEVDVVAYSMGGIVARYAAAPPPGVGSPRRLRIARLFTISSPHRGAHAALLGFLDPLAFKMHGDSQFMADLAHRESARAYPIFPYVRLGDITVGAERAAPHGEAAAWWVSNPFLQSPHIGAPTDPRILADVLRRLRHETPLSTEPRAPLP